MNRQFGDLNRAQLARLGREYMLAAQFNSRTGYAALQMNHGAESYKDVAIDNWMAVSPVYTRRMQRAMGFTDDKDVPTIFKGLQLECGLSHQYFDSHFEVVSADEGFFWLESCGPLLETEPRGEQAVRVMCHDIEDPTFDATAVATNPRARMRPVHRPPRISPEQTPHCKWRVFIDPDAEPIQERDITRFMSATELGRVRIDRRQREETGGLDYYDVDVFEQLQLERFSAAALELICKELAVQIQLLSSSLGLVIARRYGEQAALKVADFQLAGMGWTMSARLGQFLELEGGTIDDVLAVLAIHPAFQPAEYVGLEIEKLDEQRAALRLREDCPAARETELPGLYRLLRSGADAGLEALLQGVNPSIQLRRVERAELSWEILLDPTTPASKPPLPVQIAQGTALYGVELVNHDGLL